MFQVPGAWCLQTHLPFWYWKGIKLPVPVLALLTKHLTNGNKGLILTPSNQQGLSILLGATFSMKESTDYILAILNTTKNTGSW